MTDPSIIAERYEALRAQAFDEYLREQDADEERRNLLALYQQGEFKFDD